MKSVIGSDSLLTSFSMYRMLPSRARSTAWLVGTNTVRGPGPRSGGGAPQFCRKTHIWLTNEDLAQISFKPRCQTEYRINQIFWGKNPWFHTNKTSCFYRHLPSFYGNTKIDAWRFKLRGGLIWNKNLITVIQYAHVIEYVCTSYIPKVWSWKCLTKWSAFSSV